MHSSKDRMLKISYYFVCDPYKMDNLPALISTRHSPETVQQYHLAGTQQLSNEVAANTGEKKTLLKTCYLLWESGTSVLIHIFFL